MAHIEFKDKKEGKIAGSVNFDAGTYSFSKNALAYMGRGNAVTFLTPSVEQLSGASEKEQRANFKKVYGEHFEIAE